MRLVVVYTPGSEDLCHVMPCCALVCCTVVLCVCRMLTHPVTGKPLLLGPAVDAKTSRLGNTTLGEGLWQGAVQQPPFTCIHSVHAMHEVHAVCQMCDTGLYGIRP